MIESQKNIRLEGYDQLMDMLDTLPSKVSKKEIIKGLRKASTPIIRDARSRIKGYSKTLAASISVNYVSKVSGLIMVGPRRKFHRVEGERQLKHDPWFAHFVEFGTSGVGKFKNKGRARYRADQPARPFMRPAYDAKKDEALGRFADHLRPIITEHMRKNTRNVT
jgi:HK97 gp10 family phage protein